MFSYRGSTALVTGASKGLGEVFAEHLAARGMNLVLVARSRDALETLAKRLSDQYAVQCVALDADLEKRIRAKIRAGASPRHVPARIVAVTDIPRTKSGKITELAVRDVVHGRAIKNKEALANPDALELFRNLPQLAD